MKKKSLITKAIIGVFAFIVGFTSLLSYNNIKLYNNNQNQPAVKADVINNANFSSSDKFAVNNNGFTTFESALSSVQNGETITLLSDYSPSSTIEINKDVSIDLNGFNINVTSPIVVGADATLNIYNSANKVTQTDDNLGSITTYSNGITSSGSYCFQVSGTLNVYGGKFVNTSSSTSAIFCAVASSSTINVYDGYFVAVSSSSANGFTIVNGITNVNFTTFGGYWRTNGVTINIDASQDGMSGMYVNILGGTYYSVNSYGILMKGLEGIDSLYLVVMPQNGRAISISGSYGIYAEYANLTILGGTISGRSNSGIYLKATKASSGRYLKIYAGDITGQTSACDIAYASTTIYGGNFTSASTYTLDFERSTVNIYGGKFTSSSAVNLYINTGWFLDRSGSITVNGGAYNNTGWSTSYISTNGTKETVGSYTYIVNSNDTSYGKYYMPSTWLGTSYIATRSTKTGSETIQVNGSAVTLDTYSYAITKSSGSILASINNSSSITLTTALTEDIIISKEITINKNGQSITGLVKAGNGYMLTETTDQIVVTSYDNYNCEVFLRGKNYLDETMVDNFAGVTLYDHTTTTELGNIKNNSIVYFSIAFNEGYRILPGETLSVQYSLDGTNYIDISESECDGVYIIPNVCNQRVYILVLGVSNVYNVSYVNYNNEQIGVEKVLYNGSPTAKIDGNEINTARVGYTFNGWGATLTTPASEVYNLSSIKVTNDLVLYSIYSINYYNVTFYDYNQTTELGSETLAFNSTITPPEKPSRIGYNFIGWATSASASSTEVVDFNSYTLGAGDVAFYAIYERQNYTISSYEDDIYRITPSIGNYDEALTININLHNTAYSLTGDNYIVYYSLNSGTTWVQIDGTVKDGYTIPANTISANCLIKVEGITNLYPLLLKRYDDTEGKMVDYKTIMVEYGASFVSLNLDNEIPSAREHYDFVGWADGEAAAVITDWSLKSMDSKTGVILYARYTPKDYIITFKNEDGSTITTKTAKYNTTFSQIDVDDIIPDDKTGYDFIGWSTEVGGAKIATNYVIESDLSVYAIYSKKSYVVTFYNENEEKISSQTILYNEMAVDPGEQVKTGYDFKGWVTSLDSEEVVNVSEYNITKKTDFYPYYQIKKFTVEFYVNDTDTTPFETQIVNYNKYATAPEAEPEKVGYKFDGYRVSTAIVNLESYKITENTKFYAVFSLKYFEVVADGSNYSILNAEKTMALTKANHEEDLAFTLLLASGYHTTESTVVKYKIGNGEYITITDVDGVYTINKTDIVGNVYILVAGLSNEYVVNFKDKDGSNILQTKSVVYNTIVSYTGETPTASGSEFLGWSLAQSGAVVDLGEYLITGDTTFYAVFSINAYTASFYNGTDLVSSQSVTYGTTVNAELLPTPTKKGYIFKYWSDTEDGAEVKLSTTPIVADSNFYAVFEIATYTIELKYSSGETVRESWTAVYNTYTSIPDGTEYTIPTGYEIAGFSLSANGSILGTTEDGKIDCKIEDNTTFYVVFKVKNYKVTVESPSAIRITNPEGTSDITSCTYVDGLTFAVVLKEGYSYTIGTTASVEYGVDGLYTAVTYVEAEGVYRINSSTITSDITIKVTNVTNEYTLAFIVDGSEYNSQTVAYGTDISTLLPSNPTKTGYNFKGWAIVEDSTSVVTNFGTMTIGGKIYYAVFTEQNYALNTIGENVVFSDSNGSPITSGDSLLTYKKSYGFFADPTEGYYTTNVMYKVGDGEYLPLTAVGGMYTIPADSVTNSITIKVEVSNLYTITFKNYDATDIGEGVTKTIEYGTTWGNVLTSDVTGYNDRRDEGYTFMGWSLLSGNGRAIADTYQITSDVTVYARYERSSTITITTQDTFKIVNSDGVGITSCYAESSLTFKVVLEEGYKLPAEEILSLRVVVNESEIAVQQVGDSFVIATGLLSADAEISLTCTLNHQVEVKFLDWDNSELYVIDIEYGTTYGDNSEVFASVEIGAPSDESYKFAGWSLTQGSGATISESYSFKTDTTLYPVKVEKQRSSISGGKGYQIVDSDGNALVSFINDSLFSFKIILDEGYRPENNSTIKISYKLTGSDTTTLIEENATVNTVYSLSGISTSLTIIVENITNYHIVTFKNSNATEDTITTKSVLYQTTLAGSLTAVTGYEDRRDLGYTFDGWSLEKNGELISDEYTVTGNVTLYAHYTESANITISGGTGYTVTDTAGATLTTAKKEAKLSFKIQLDDGYYAKDGGLVVTYIIGANTYEIVADGEVYTIETGNLIGNVTIVVTNISNLYKVSFYSGAGVYQTAQVAYGSNLTAPTNNPTMQYYTFVGWSETEGSSVVVDVSTLVMPKEEKKLYAYYTPNSYSISSNSPSYVINAEGTPTYLTDFEFTLSYKNGYHRTDEELVVYYSVDGGDLQTATVENETITIAGSTIKGSILIFVNSGITNKYQITYHYGKNNVYTETREIEYNTTTGANIGSVGSTLTNLNSVTGYTFAGWSATEDGEKITNWTNYPITADADYYAVYTINSYTITFIYGLDKSLKTEAQYTYLTKSSDIVQPDASVEGYDWQWNIEITDVVKDETYTASYTTKSYTVTFIYGLSGEESESAVVLYTTVGVAEPVSATKEGHTHIWKNEEGETVNLANETFSSNKTYTAVYTAKTYSVSTISSYYTVDKTSCTFNTELVLTLTFKTGYYAKNNLIVKYMVGNDTTELMCEVNPYEAGTTTAQVIIPADSITDNIRIKVASEYSNVYTVTYHYGESDSKTYEVNLTYGNKGTLISSSAPTTTAELAGRTLNGWSSVQNGEVITNWSDITVTGDMDFYAVYTNNTYTVSSGEPSKYNLSESNLTYGEDKAITINLLNGYRKNGETITIVYTLGTETQTYDCTIVSTESNIIVKIPADKITANVIIFVTEGISNEYKINYHYGLNNETTKARSLEFNTSGDIILAYAPDKEESNISGRTLSGWSLDESAETVSDLSSYKLTSDIDLYAVYSNNTYSVFSGETDKYSLSVTTAQYGTDLKITLNTLNGYHRTSEPLVVEYMIGSSEERYTNATINGEEITISGTNIIGNITIYVDQASISNKYILTFVTGVEGDQETIRQAIYNTKDISGLAPNADVAGYNYVWTINSVEADLTNVTVTNDLIVIASYTDASYAVKAVDQAPYTIIGGTTATHGTNYTFTISFSEGYHANASSKVQFKAGNGQYITLSEDASGNYTINGADIVGIITIQVTNTSNTNVVNFLAYNQETVIETKEVEYGTLCINIPSIPQRTGYNGLGWAVVGETDLFDFENTPITENINLYAVYKLKTYQVTIVGDGYTVKTENGDDFETVTHGQTVKIKIILNGIYRRVEDFNASYKIGTNIGLISNNPADTNDTVYTIDGGNIVGNMEITVKGISNKYTVKFYDKDQTTILAEGIYTGNRNVIENITMPTAENVTEVIGYNFSGKWVSSKENILRDGNGIILASNNNVVMADDLGTNYSEDLEFYPAYNAVSERINIYYYNTTDKIGYVSGGSQTETGFVLNVEGLCTAESISSVYNLTKGLKFAFKLNLDSNSGYRAINDIVVKYAVATRTDYENFTTITPDENGVYTIARTSTNTSLVVVVENVSNYYTATINTSEGTKEFPYIQNYTDSSVLYTFTGMGTVSGDTNKDNYQYGTDYNFEVVLSDLFFGVITVYANGEKLTPVGNIYTVENTTGDITITYTYEAYKKSVLTDAIENGVYKISNSEQLHALSLVINNNLDPTFASANYELVNDIDFSNSALVAIGTINYPFTGKLDGVGYEIKNVLINETNYAGLFGYTIGATIIDLGVNAVVTSESLESAGIIVGGAFGETIIINSYISGSVNGQNARAVGQKSDLTIAENILNKTTEQMTDARLEELNEFVLSQKDLYNFWIKDGDVIKLLHVWTSDYKASVVKLTLSLNGNQSRLVISDTESDAYVEGNTETTSLYIYLNGSQFINPLTGERQYIYLYTTLPTTSGIGDETLFASWFVTLYKDELTKTVSSEEWTSVFLNAELLVNFAGNPTGSENVGYNGVMTDYTGTSYGVVLLQEGTTNDVYYRFITPENHGTVKIGTSNIYYNTSFVGIKDTEYLVTVNPYSAYKVKSVRILNGSYGLVQDISTDFTFTARIDGDFGTSTNPYIVEVTFEEEEFNVYVTYNGIVKDIDKQNFNTLGYVLSKPTTKLNDVISLVGHDLENSKFLRLAVVNKKGELKELSGQEFTMTEDFLNTYANRNDINDYKIDFVVIYLPIYTINIDAEENGTLIVKNTDNERLEGESLKVVSGTMLSLIITPNTGYAIDYVKVNGQEVEVSRNKAELKVTGDAQVEVKYKNVKYDINYLALSTTGTSLIDLIENTRLVDENGNLLTSIDKDTKIKEIIQLGSVDTFKLVEYSILRYKLDELGEINKDETETVSFTANTISTILNSNGTLDLNRYVVKGQIKIVTKYLKQLLLTVSINGNGDDNVGSFDMLIKSGYYDTTNELKDKTSVSMYVDFRSTITINTINGVGYAFDGFSKWSSEEGKYTITKDTTIVLNYVLAPTTIQLNEDKTKEKFEYEYSTTGTELTSNISEVKIGDELNLKYENTFKDEITKIKLYAADGTLIAEAEGNSAKFELTQDMLEKLSGGFYYETESKITILFILTFIVLPVVALAVIALVILMAVKNKKLRNATKSALESQMKTNVTRNVSSFINDLRSGKDVGQVTDEDVRRAMKDRKNGGK